MPPSPGSDWGSGQLPRADRDTLRSMNRRVHRNTPRQGSLIAFGLVLSCSSILATRSRSHRAARASGRTVASPARAILTSLALALGGCGGQLAAEKRSTGSHDQARQGIAQGQHPAASASCRLADVVPLHWPVDGVLGRDIVINNYVDLDPRPGELRDYRSNTGDAAKTYDGHQGLDINLASMRLLGQIAVRSVGSGTVMQVIDTQADNNLFRSLYDVPVGLKANRIRVMLDNGFSATYMHNVRDSAQVSEGDRVTPGQLLAYVGSSGISTIAHLDFVLQDCFGQIVSTFKEGLWHRVIPYDPPASLMDVVLRPGGIERLGQIKDPEPSPSKVRSGQPLGVAMITAGNHRDGLRVAVQATSQDPEGAERKPSLRRTLPRTHDRHGFHDLGDLVLPTGTWRLDFSIDGHVFRQELLEVSH